MSHQLLSLIPMKSLTVWRGHSTRPSLSAGTARKASGHLSGRRPLHLANARPFSRLKAPLGLSLLRCATQTRACLWQAEQAHHTTSKEKQSVPDGERPVVHIAIVCGFWQGASGWTHPVFVSSWLGVRQNASPQLLIGFFRHRLAPLVRGAFAGYFHCQMREPAIGCSTVPVLDLRGNVHHMEIILPSRSSSSAQPVSMLNLQALSSYFMFVSS